MSGQNGSFLRTIGSLTTRDQSRTVTLPDGGGWTGELVGTIPLGESTSLVLVVGGARAFTPFLPNETPVEVHLKAREAR